MSIPARAGKVLLAEGNADDVEPAVDVDDLAGHGPGEVAGEPDGGPADVFWGDVLAEWRDLRNLLGMVILASGLIALLLLATVLGASLLLMVLWWVLQRSFRIVDFRQ